MAQAESDRSCSEQLQEMTWELKRSFAGLEAGSPWLAQAPLPGYTELESVSGYQTFHYEQPFALKYNGGVLPELSVAYETWGELNSDGTNVVLVFTGLTNSSHVRSNETNPTPGWWEKFIGPGRAIDTSKSFVVCCNHIGGCFGSTGPSSNNPLTGKPYGTTFPMVSVEDMVHAQFLLLDHLGVDKLHASVGSSLGGMCSILSAALYPDRVGRVISISACAQSQPSCIAPNYLLRQAIMVDPNWKGGHYYGVSFPMMGMKLAREIATMTYRSGPEWKERFGRKLIDEDEPPSLCPSFEIEAYIMHQGEAFCNKYDPNSLLYITKAIDMFDMGEGFSSLRDGMSRVRCPVLVLGINSDILFPTGQQRELVDLLKASGNDAVAFYEINSIYGHDTFLLDLSNVGGAIKGHLETELPEYGVARSAKPSRLNEINGKKTP